VHRDVVDRHAVDLALERPVVCVAVYDEIRTVATERAGEPVGAEHEPEPLGLTDQRRLDRGVMQQRDADPAGVDRSEALVEAVDVAGRLRVRLAEERLAEVRPFLAEPADETLDPRNTDAHTDDRQDRVRALKHDDAGFCERALEIVGTVRLPVVVSEHGDDRDLQTAASIGDDARLVHLPVLRQVTGEQHEVGVTSDARERLADAVAVVGARVDVPCRSYSDRGRHAMFIPGIRGCTPRETETTMPWDAEFEEILGAMKLAAATLRDGGVPFALAGGLAVYARGGPPTEHDVDVLVRQDDAERAVELLGDAGFRAERPPEGWLYKVFDADDNMIDLIFAPNSRPERVPAILERATEIEVYAITLPVMTVTDVLESKLLTIKEHEASYDDVLEIVRTCREQVEWDALRSRVGDSPYAKAFFTLVDELGLTA
jgi:hypothetical protein